MSIFEVAKDIVRMKQAVVVKFGKNSPIADAFYYTCQTRDLPYVKESFDTLMKINA